MSLSITCYPIILAVSSLKLSHCYSALAVPIRVVTKCLDNRLLPSRAKRLWSFQTNSRMPVVQLPFAGGSILPLRRISFDQLELNTILATHPSRTTQSPCTGMHIYSALVALLLMMGINVKSPKTTVNGHVWPSTLLLGAWAHAASGSGPQILDKFRWL